MRWPWQPKTIPTMESRGSYTDTVVTALYQEARGQNSNALATAALESSAGLWGRAFATAELSGLGLWAEALGPDVLLQIGRSLCRRGEVVYLIEVRAGEPMLIEASDWLVRGGPNPASWYYQLQLSGPSDINETRIVSGERVLHPKYAVDPMRPHVGLGPLEVAESGGKLAGLAEQKLAQALNAPVLSHLIVVPDSGGRDDSTADDVDEDDDAYAGVRADLAKAEGGAYVAEELSGSSDESTRRWQIERMIPDPPEHLVNLYDMSRASVYRACGIPDNIFSGGSTGAREGWRELLHGTLTPVMTACVIPELERKLNLSGVSADWSELKASDLQGRARAAKSLVDAGFELDEVRTKAGLS